MSFIHIDPSLCIKDGGCVESCPHFLLHWAEDGFPVADEAGRAACIRCGHCASVCTPGALTNENLAQQDFREAAGLDRDADPMAYAMLTRRSVRSFKSEPVPKEELRSLLETVRYAPTGNNAQHLWWIVTLNNGQTEPLARLALEWMRKTYMEDAGQGQGRHLQDPVLRGAPHLALCCGPESSRWAPVNAAIAVAHLELLAASRGLGACWAGTFLRAVEAWPPLAAELDLPAGQKPYAALFLGYPRLRYRLVPERKPLAVHWR